LESYLPVCATALLLLQLQVEAVADAPKTLTLDTRDLTLHKVKLLSGSPAAAAAAPGAVVEEAGATAAEQSLQYALAEKHPVSLACAVRGNGVQQLYTDSNLQHRHGQCIDCCALCSLSKQQRQQLFICITNQ
jgi:hypothetical protein